MITPREIGRVEFYLFVRCVRGIKSRSLFWIELKLVVVSDEDKAGRCFGRS